MKAIKSIRFRLPIMFMMASAIPAIVAIFWISNLLNERMNQMLQQRVNDSAVIVSNVFNQYSEDLLLRARLLAQDSRTQELLKARKRIELINHLSTLSDDLNLNLYGAVLEVFDENTRLLASVPKRGAQHVPDTMVYTALTKGEFKTSRFFQNDKLKISTALPVFHPSSSQALGVVTLSFDVSDKLTNEIHKLADAEVLIFSQPINQAPRLLASTLDMESSERLIQRFANSDPQANEDYMVAALQGNARNGSYYLMAAVETREMRNVVGSLKDILFFIAGAAAFLALIFALGLSRNLVNRILYLVHAARKVEEGELDQQIVIVSQDEFGTLASTLDSMREEIKSTLVQKESMITNLTIRDKINQAIILESGSSLLKEVLMIIIRAVDAQKGSIMLVDEEAQQLVLKVVFDPEQADEAFKVLEHVTFAIGEGIAGKVAASGEAIICNDTQSDGRFKTYRFQAMDRRIWNMICIPLQVNDEILGVISLDNKSNGFSERDLELVQHLANQIAIAIQNAELYERSIIDGLTGLFIRRYFEDLLDQEIKRSNRFDTPTSLLMFDIDHFKRFNDTYGHQVGDWVIQKVAHIAQESIRDGVDHAARYGGEEFAVIMPETDLKAAMVVAERIRKAIEDSFVFHEGTKLKITVSLGCAEYPAQAGHKEELIRHADTALYASKHKGRNCATAYAQDLAMYERT